MKTKLIAFVLCFSMIVALASGCRTDVDTSSDVSNLTANEGDASTTSDATASTTGNGADSQTNNTTGNGADSQITTTTKKVDKTTAKTTSPSDFKVGTAAVPKRTLQNKKITLYSWLPLQKDSRYWTTLMSKEYGVTFDVQVGAHRNYWDTVAQKIVAGAGPDIIETPYWNFYPRPITKNLIQPLDDKIDFSDGLWNDVRADMEKLQWDGKTYIPLEAVGIQSLCFYNKTMFKNYGVKTPREYFEEDNWTYETFKKVADQFVSLNADKTIKTAGFVVQTDNLVVTTGMEAIQYDAKENYKINLKNNKFATLMNWMHSMGQAGSKSWYRPADAIQSFAKQEVAMIVTSATAPFFDDRLGKMDVDWVPLPKQDAKSPYTLEVMYDTQLTLANGAKNVEGALLAIEFRKWLTLGSAKVGLIAGETNAATKRYNLAINKVPGMLTAEQTAWTKKMLGMHKYTYVSSAWSSWLNLDGTVPVFPGMLDVYNGKAWSAVVEQVYPQVNAQMIVLMN